MVDIDWLRPSRLGPRRLPRRLLFFAARIRRLFQPSPLKCRLLLLLPQQYLSSLGLQPALLPMVVLSSHKHATQLIVLPLNGRAATHTSPTFLERAVGVYRMRRVEQCRLPAKKVAAVLTARTHVTWGKVAFG